MNIIVETIPHAGQRYPTVGDWYFNELNNIDTLSVVISDMKNPDYEFLVAIHELVEAYLCRKRGIAEESVSQFDIEFENNRKPGNTDEPGNHPLAPYYHEHCFATRIESEIAVQLGINWEEYDAAVNNL